MTKEERKKIIDKLPSEIQGYKRRLVTFTNSCTILYSKDANLLIKDIKSSETRIKDLGKFSKDLLYEVTAINLDECVQKMKLKIELNKRIKSDFPKNIILSFSTNFKKTVEDVNYYYKLFEVYLVLDTNSNSQFFAIASINPLSDTKFIIEAVNDLKKQIKNKKLLNLSTNEFDYTEFNLPTVIHFYSNSFSQKKEELTTLFKQHSWSVKFRDQYYFEKQDNNKEIIILCEGKNVDMLNELKLKNKLFSQEHNSVSIFQNIKTNTKYCLRDKDYLLKEEINRLKKKFNKYYILEYYCIENYLYHPSNIEELKLIGFNKDIYIDDIIRQKKENESSIIAEFDTIRKSYKELTENHFKKIDNPSEILIKEISSSNFEIFYQHFDMKKKFNKKIIEKYNLNADKLSKTKWFKDKIENILK